MSPPLRQKFSLAEAYSKNAKESAVLILIYEKENEPYVVFTERKVYKGAHSGQISFPGGKKDDTDIDFEFVALRETEEEIGVNRSEISVLGQLTHLYIPVSNFLVFPFVGILHTEPDFVKEEKEVHKIIEIKLDDLLQDINLIEKKINIPENNIQFKTPAYKVNDTEIWGATAMILSEFLEIVR